jgi:hypothetical protein
VDPKRNSGMPASGGRRGGPGAGPGAQVSGAGGYAGAPAVPRRPAAPPAGTPRSVNVQEGLDQLGRSIQQLRIEFERFFNGALPVPPEELRNRIVVQLRQLRNLNLTAAVDNFRLGDFEARFNTYNELYNRRLREREEGRPAGRALAEVEAPRYDTSRGILVGDAVEPAAAEALYVGLSRAGEAPRFDLDSFQTYIERQAAAIRARTGCAQVQFRLADEDGRLKLKARPVA